MNHEDITRSDALPGAAFGRCASRRNCRCCAIICFGSIRASRHDRFHGFMDDSFIERYAAKCADDGTVIIAYIEDGVVRGAAELHPPDQSPDSLPEIAFSVEARVRRQGVGSILFKKLIAEARSKGYRACGSPPARRTRRCGRSPTSSARI